MNKLIMNILLLTSISLPAHAVLIEVDWQLANDTSLTYDTATGLEWLDVTETAGLSYNQVSAELGAGGAYEGFVFASQQQILGLFSSIGLPDEIPNLPEYLGGETEIASLLNFWGVTWDLGTGERTEFLTSNNTNLQPGEHWSGRVFWLEVGDTGVTSEYLARSDDYSNATIGSALVRTVSPVPVPAAVWFFMVGLISLLGVSRRK